MPRQRNASFPVKVSRRRTGWEEGTGGSIPTNVSSSSSGFLGAAVTALLDGLTLVRTRGFVRATLTAVAGANDGFQGAVGIGITTAQAVAAGIASCPIPVSDADWDGWLWHQFFSVGSSTATIADGVNSVGVNFQTEIDSKAMRKLSEDMALYAAFQMTENGTSVMDIWHESRMLFKLP